MTRTGKKGQGGVGGWTDGSTLYQSREAEAKVRLTACHRLAEAALGILSLRWAMGGSGLTERQKGGIGTGHGRCVFGCRGRRLADARLLHLCTAFVWPFGQSAAVDTPRLAAERVWIGGMVADSSF